MRTIRRTIEIQAPVERVYEFLTTPQNLPSVWPSLIDVTRTERSADGAHSFEWSYKMAGLKFHGRTKAITVRPHSYVESRTEGEIQSTFRWIYDRSGPRKTQLTVEMDYVLPTPVLGQLVEAVAVKMNEHEMDALFANVKATMEGAISTPEMIARHAH